MPVFATSKKIPRPLLMFLPLLLSLFLALFQWCESFQLVHHRHNYHENGRLVPTSICTGASSSSAATTTSSSTPTASDLIIFSKTEEVAVVVPIFDEMAHYAGICLLESDLCRDAINKPADQTEFVAKGATNWMDDASSLRLHQVVNRVQLNLLPQLGIISSSSNTDRDNAWSWMRWIKSIPCPAILDLTSDFQRAVQQTALSVVNNPKGTKTLALLEQDAGDFLQRLACRIVLLPSGTALSSPLVETSSSLIYGKLLYGGVTRSRLLQRQQGQGQSQQQQLVGERQAVKTSVKDNVEAWTMFGGPPRMYQALDMGPAAVLEVVLLPRGTSVQTDISSSLTSGLSNQNMILTGGASTLWTPQKMFAHYQPFDATIAAEVENAADSTAVAPTSASAASTLYGRQRNEAFRSNFQSTVGGLQLQIDAIVRRVLDGRVIRPADSDNDNRNRSFNGNRPQQQQQHVNGGSGEISDDDDDDDDWKAQERNLSMASLEAQELELLGLTPVRGLLLYGPPGCGKTALAREISRALRARTPKIVSAPELLDRWVGGSEKLVRALFAEAEAELVVCRGDARKSALHVIVIDEIDAVFRKRTAAEDSGEATRSSVVNQILAKLDGVNAIPNVLFVGMTNRRELLDEALLRPGRMEVQIEIPLPNKEGRREILQIHFNALRQRGRLSKPLCCAIDGVPLNRSGDDNDHALTGMPSVDDEKDVAAKPRPLSKRKKIKTLLRNLARKATIMATTSSSYSAYYDLAAKTDGYSGADIAGLVRSAGSLALARARKDGTGVQGLLITLEDVMQALVEVKKR